MKNILILLGILGRLIPHPSNFTPVGAVALVGGSKLNGLSRWMIPFIALIISDILLEIFYGTQAFSFSTPFVYASFAISIFFGRFINGNNRYVKLGGFAFLASVQFFIITNFAVWMEGLIYPKTLSGLYACYLMALPYFQNSLLGDLCWSFGLFAVIERSQVWISKKAAHAAG